MYAAVMHLAFEADLAPSAAKVFTEELLPRVKAAPGFVSGYWLDPSDGEGLGFMLFEEQQQAQRASAADQWQAPGVKVAGVDIRRVAATAQSLPIS